MIRVIRTPYSVRCSQSNGEGLCGSTLGGTSHKYYRLLLRILRMQGIFISPQLFSVNLGSPFFVSLICKSQGGTLEGSMAAVDLGAEIADSRCGIIIMPFRDI